MKIKAIVYTSKTGFTRQYARLLAEKTGLSAYPLDEAISKLPRGSEILYLGWIHASRIKGYSRAAKCFSVCAVCGVGLCDTGTTVEQVGKASSIPAELPLFTLQGGFDRGKLKGFDKFLISMLTKGLSAQKQRSPQDERMLQLLCRDGNYVCEENLKDVLHWYRKSERL